MVADAVLDAALRRGTLVHQGIAVSNNLVGSDVVPLEDLDWPDMPPIVEPYLCAHIAFRQSTGFAPIRSEWMGYNSALGYAGTLDAIGTVPDGRIWLIDYKSGAVLPSVAVQTIAYSELDEVKAEFPVVERHGLQLKPDASFRLSAAYTSPYDFDVFKSALNIHRYWQRIGV